AVAGVEDDAVVDRDPGNRLRQRGVELLLELELLRHRAPGVLDDVKEQDAADEGPVGVVRHRSGSLILRPRRSARRPGPAGLFPILPRQSVGLAAERRRISIHCRAAAKVVHALPAMAVTQEQIHAALAEIVDPNTGKDLVSTKSVK